MKCPLIGDDHCSPSSIGLDHGENEASIHCTTHIPSYKLSKAMNDSHPNQKRGLESDDDDFIEVCSPPRKIPSVATAQLDDDTPIVLSSTMINPNVDYPHGRRDCGKNPFSAENAQQYCEKCYCHVCDGPAKECSSWAVHCFAKPITKDFSVSTDQVTILQSTGASAFWEHRMNGRRQRSEAVFDNEADAFWDSLLSRRDPTESRRRKERPAVTKRITDVLAEKLALMVRMTDNKSAINTRKMTEDDFLSIVRSSAPLFNNPVPVASNLKMEGDISELRLHNSFFVEGIRIGWPFSTILTPQRQMAIHIIKALKRKSHVVLESPTGTGKSAAILCSVLAWQRYQAKCSQAKKGQSVGLSQETALTLSCDEDVDIGEATEPDVPTIFYCSRTHSQVAQMVASLRKTPYRPRMTVLGSRERLCINREVKKQKVSSVSINQSCRDRKIETDRKRKKFIKDPRKSYDDDNPVPFPSEEELEIEETYNQGVYKMDTEIRTGTRVRNNRATCLHYQQLSSDKSVRAIKERFIKPAVEINDCCKGDEHTKLGVMDIEDLVEFGKNPFRESGITLYREEANTGPFGFTIEDRQYGGVQVAAIKPSGAADKDGRIKLRDWILSINDVSTKSWTLNQVKNQIVNLKKDPLILTVQRGHAEIDHDNGYSDHALCPYYLARALTSSANLIFARKFRPKSLDCALCHLVC